MRVSNQFGSVVLALFLVACVGEDEPGTGLDAAVTPPGDPDAAVAEIDAAVVVPDATPGDPDADVPDAVPPISFSAEIVPILMARCGGCHLKATGGAGGLSLGVQAELSYGALIDRPTLNPDPDCVQLKLVDAQKRDPSQSSLYLKIAGDVCGTRMPKGVNGTPLPGDQLELFARWIAEGAQNN